MEQMNGRGIIEEVLARVIYDSWIGQPGWAPWAAGGNSDKQEEARRLARAALSDPAISYAAALCQQASATKDEALRVANRLRELIDRYWSLAYAEGKEGRDHDTQDGAAQECRGEIEAALRTIALAGEAPSDGVEVDRDSDGELLIDWFPSPGRMLTMSLRHDGRLSYAFRWDGEQAHGTAQMPPAVQSVALICSCADQQDCDLSCQPLASAATAASGAVGEAAGQHVAWLVPMLNDKPRLFDDLAEARAFCSQQNGMVYPQPLIVAPGYPYRPAGLPGTSNGQENGNG